MMDSIGLRENATSSYPFCSWSCKLEVLLNNVLDSLVATRTFTNDETENRKQAQNSTDENSNQEISPGDNDKFVVVKNYVVGGTNSEARTNLLEYNLHGLDLTEYNIPIVAFGANDMQAPLGDERDRMCESMQRFMRIVKS